MKLLAILLLFCIASAFVQRDYGGPDYQEYAQEEGYDSYDDEQSQYLNQVLWQVRYAVQRARIYSEGKLQEVQEIIVSYRETNSEPDEYAEQLIQQVESQARRLQQQVYKYLQYSPERYGEYPQYFESDEYSRYQEQGQGYPSGSQLRSVLREIRDVLQTTQSYNERKLEKARQILQYLQQSGEQPSQQTRQLIQEVKSEANSLQNQVYQSLRYARQQYSEGYEYYGEQGQYGSQVETVLSEVQSVLQSAQYYLQRKLQIAQRILNYYEQSDEEPSRQVRQLVQETKSRSCALSNQVYTYTQYFQQYYGEHYEESSQYSEQRYCQYNEESSQYPQQRYGQYYDDDSQYPQQRYGQYYEEDSQYPQHRYGHHYDDDSRYSQQPFGRYYGYAEYPQQRYGHYYEEELQYPQQSYGQYYGEDSQYPQQRYGQYYEQDYQYPQQSYGQYYEEDSQHPQQSYGHHYDDDSQYSQQPYGRYYGYAEYNYPQQQYSRYSQFGENPRGYGGYSEGHQYERQLVRVLTQVINVLQNAQYRSQQGLRQAQKLFSEQQQSGQQLQLLVQHIRFAVSALQQDVYEYLQYDREDYDYDVRYNYRSQLQQIREMLQQGTDAETIDSYVRENFPSGSPTTQMIRGYLQEDRYQLQRYLDYVLEGGYSGSGHSSSEQYRVAYSFHRRYGLPVRDSYYQFAKYLVQTFRRDLSSASETETVREIAKHFLRQVDGVGEGVLQHAMEFFRQYRTQAGEYYYRAVEDAVRQQLVS